MTIHIVTYKELRNRIPKTPFASIGVDQIHIRKRAGFPWYNILVDNYNSGRAVSEDLVIGMCTTYCSNPMYGLDPKTLDIRWSFLSYTEYPSNITSDGEYIYASGINFQNDFGKLIILDYDGNNISSFEIGYANKRSNNILMPDRILFNTTYTDENRIYHYKLYIIDYNDLPNKLTIIKSLNEYIAHIAEDEYIYATYNDPETHEIRIYKLDKDGNVLETSNTTLDILAFMTLGDDKILYGKGLFHNTYICACDKDSLEEIKCVKIDYDVQYISQGSYSNGYLYVLYTIMKDIYTSTEEKRLLKIDVNTMDIVWDIPLYSYSTGDWGGLVVVIITPKMAVDEDGTIFLNLKNLYAINPDGSIKWEIDDFNGLLYPVIMPSGRIILSHRVGDYIYLSIINKNTGEELLSKNIEVDTLFVI